MPEKYDVIIIDGTICEYAENDADALHYHNVTWDDATTICRFAFEQGFACVLWIPEEGPANDGTAGDCSIL